jgi:hypothetical protein
LQRECRAQKVTYELYLIHCRALDTQRNAARVLLRFLQMKWEQIDGDSILLQARRTNAMEKYLRDETRRKTQRERLAEAAEAKRLAEGALVQRMQEEQEARAALEKGDRRSHATERLSRIARLTVVGWWQGVKLD